MCETISYQWYVKQERTKFAFPYKKIPEMAINWYMTYCG